MKNTVAWILCAITALGCAGPTVPLYGKFHSGMVESFTGEVTANFMVGGGTMYGKGVKTGIVCKGETGYTGCGTSQRMGRADLICTDGRVIKAQFFVESCVPLKGWGSGVTSKGDEFLFIFGGSETDAERFWNEERERLI